MAGESLAATSDGLPPEVDAMLKGAVLKFAEAKVQGEAELKKAGGAEKEAAATHYNSALDQMAGLLEHLPSDQAEAISKQLEEVRGKMR